MIDRSPHYGRARGEVVTIIADIYTFNTHGYRTHYAYAFLYTTFVGYVKNTLCRRVKYYAIKRFKDPFPRS